MKYCTATKNFYKAVINEKRLSKSKLKLSRIQSLAYYRRGPVFEFNSQRHDK